MAPITLVDTDRFSFHMRHHNRPMSCGFSPIRCGLTNSTSPRAECSAPTIDESRNALPLTPASVSTVTTPSCTVPPNAAPTPLLHGSVSYLIVSAPHLYPAALRRELRTMDGDADNGCIRIRGRITFGPRRIS